MPNVRTTPAADVSREFQTGLPPDVRTRPYISFDFINYSVTPTLAPGASEEIEIYAPPGYIYEVENVYLRAYAPPGATSGQHFIRLQTLGAIHVVKGTSNYDRLVEFIYSHWLSAGVQAWPPDDQLLAIQSCVADVNRPIKFVYDNQTDADQTNTRVVQLVVRRTKV